jgi:hypothetical protein
MDSHDASDITGLYGRCPHCNWSLKAKSGDESLVCGSCKKPVNIVNGQFVVLGATSPPKARQLNQTRNSIGCFVVAAILVILAVICMRGGSDSKADCEQARLRENQRRYAEAQRNPNYNPEYVGPCK